MKPLKTPSNTRESAYMAMRKEENIERALNNPNENWMWKKLQRTSYKWSRQARFGYRIFDFWCHRLGVAIEVDGPEHNVGWDMYRDEYNFRHSAVVVLRVRNRNEADADRAIGLLGRVGIWSKRKGRLGLRGKGKKRRRARNIKVSQDRSLLREYLARVGGR